jgi:DNA polymerase elongation subunit (family B)
MQWTLATVCSALFVVGEDGTIGMPEQLKELGIAIGDSVYRMGIGGLHSSEQKAIHYATDDTILVDRDVASYYPAIILNTGMYPEQMGPNFLTVYRDIVRQRLDAKKRGDKVAADSLKITINGTFGKLGSPWSTLYAPNLLIQVTVTGQLALLMLIERLELRGIPVVSANTDGLVIKCPKRLDEHQERKLPGDGYLDEQVRRVQGRPRAA